MTTDPIHVMVIDDEVHILRLIRRILERVGFRVTESSSAAYALDILRDPNHARPDVITCDISMPDMTGFQFLTALKDHPELAAIPVVMLTAMGQIGEANRARDMGASDYITKPFSAISLVEVLRAQVVTD